MNLHNVGGKIKQGKRAIHLFEWITTPSPVAIGKGYRSTKVSVNEPGTGG